MIGYAVRFGIWTFAVGTGMYVASPSVDWCGKVFCVFASGLLCAGLDQLDKCRHCGNKR